MQLRASKRLPHLRQGGFALVISLMLVVLLTTLAFGLLTISSIEVRKGGRETARIRAQANARLALELAIGKLQRTAGPDQRVTARAEVTDSKDHGRWVGVWRSTTKQGEGELPAIRWDDRESVLIDTRSHSTAGTDDFFEDWLVSGDGVTPDSPGAELASLVGDGTVAGKDDQVEAPLVRIDDGAGNAGAYAYWVSDESMKASVNAPALPGQLGDATFQPKRYGVGVLDGLASVDDAREEDLAKVIDYRQAVLSGSAAPDAWSRHFHSVGARANAVLSDPLRGGLKADLSAYFEKGGIAAKDDLLVAASDTTSLLGGSRRKIHGPKLGALRSFAALSAQTGGGLMPAAAATQTRSDKFSAVPKMSQFGSQPVHPVMAAAEVYTRMSYVRGYGEARTSDGKAIEARAWCEAEVQRLPSYVESADPAEQPAFTAAGAPNPALSPASLKFGRRFAIISFRWLSPTEV